MQFKDIFFVSCFRMIPFNIYLCVFVCRAKSIGNISVLSVSLLPLPLPYFSSSCTFSSTSPSSPLFSLSLLVVIFFLVITFSSDLPLFLNVNKEESMEGITSQLDSQTVLLFDTLIE